MNVSHIWAIAFTLTDLDFLYIYYDSTLNFAAHHSNGCFYSVDDYQIVYSLQSDLGSTSVFFVEFVCSKLCCSLNSFPHNPNF